MSREKEREDKWAEVKGDRRARKRFLLFFLLLYAAFTFSLIMKILFITMWTQCRVWRPEKGERESKKARVKHFLREVSKRKKVEKIRLCLLVRLFLHPFQCQNTKRSNHRPSISNSRKTFARIGLSRQHDVKLSRFGLHPSCYAAREQEKLKWIIYIF